MPSPAEQSRGSRPWWREPLPPEDPVAREDREDRVDRNEREGREGPGSIPAGQPPRQPGPHEPPGRRLRRSSGSQAAEPGTVPAPAPPQRSAAGPSGRHAPGPAVDRPPPGPADETIVLPPVPDPTSELPPVPAEPGGFVTGPPSAPGSAAPSGTARGSAPGPSAPSRTSPAEGEAGAWRNRLDRRDRSNRTVGSDGDRRDRLIALSGGALAVVLILAGVGLLASRWQDGEPAASGAATATAVDPATVHGSATSVQRPDGGITYDIGNTLDGNPRTAWNSNGAKDGRGPGITLTYRFATPTDLRSITLRNGYQKVRTTDGVDLWPLNERVQQLEVATDTGRWTWDLKDTKDPQTLRQTFGRTKVVRLKIVKIYPSRKYRDVAISEIAFTAASR